MFRSLIERLPSQCLVCRRWPAQPVCAPCHARFSSPTSRCAICALPTSAEQPHCGACLTHPGALDACFAAVDYAYPWADLLARFKFGQQPGLARLLARLLRQQAGVVDALALATCVLPLPLSRERLLERGYNQSLLLARCLMADFGSDKVWPQMLLRTTHRPPQSALKRAERLRNVDGVFAVQPLEAHRLRHADVVLVDDVMTSGASLQAAAQVLRLAGAQHITALVVARTE